MNRRQIDRVKAQAHELLRRIDEMERCAGWTRFEKHPISGVYLNQADKGGTHPDDHFNGGQFTASVKRASMDLSRSLVDLRR